MGLVVLGQCYFLKTNRTSYPERQGQTDRHTMNMWGRLSGKRYYFWSGDTKACGCPKERKYVPQLCCLPVIECAHISLAKVIQSQMH
jgi:hypothetical protein